MAGHHVSTGTLTDGAHTCCFYDTDEQQEAVLSEFIGEGLASGSKILCVAESASTRRVLEGWTSAPEVQPAVRRGQLRVSGSEETYLAGGAFVPERMQAYWLREMARAVEEGYSGLRVTGDVTWYTRDLPGVGRLMQYERTIDALLPGTPGAALCQYDRRRLSDELLSEAAATHPLVTGDHPMPEEAFRVLKDPWPDSFRLVGELDIAGVPVLAEALDTAVADGASQVRIDLAGLRFVDAAGTSALCRPATEHGIAVVLCNPGPTVHKVLTLLGTERVPEVDLATDAGC